MTTAKDYTGRTFDSAHAYQDPAVERPESVARNAKALRSFASLTALAQYAKGHVEGDPAHRSSLKADAGYGFNVGTWDDVHDLVATGWHAPRANVDRIVDNVRESIRPFITTDFEPVYDVSGAEVDIDRFLTGEPENMIEQILAPTLKHGRVVRVLAAIGGSSHIGADRIENHGAMICALIESLALMGLEVELHVSFTVTGSYNSEHTTHVLVKHAGDIADFDDIMLACAYADVQRRLVFAVREREGDTMRAAIGADAYGSYGSGQTAPTWLRDYLTPDVFIGRPSEEAWAKDDKARAAWVLSKIEGLDLS
jgi:hypothetical protein